MTTRMSTRMSKPLHRRSLFHAGLAGALGACITPARACEFFSTTMRIVHPWTRETAEDAESAIVCMVFEDVSRDDRLIAVQTPVAKAAELGGELALPRVDFRIPGGVRSELSERGTYVRLTGLLMPLDTGRAYPLTLMFEHGGEAQGLLTVNYARFL